MSRPSLEAFSLTHPGSFYQHHTTSPSGPPAAVVSLPIISHSNPLTSEDARLLDPSYLSSVALYSQHRHHHGDATTFTHIMPYIDPQGTLHDPDYRPFPLIRYTKHSTPSPFAIRKPYWESEADDCDTEFGDSSRDGDDDGYGTDDSLSNTPTSTIPFICYFLETHPLGTPLPAGSSSSHLFGEKNRTNNCYGLGKKNKGNQGRGGCRSQAAATYMRAKFSTGVIGRSSGYTHSPNAPTTTSLPAVAQYADTLLASPEPMDDVGMTKGRRGWCASRLWKKGEKD
jgi:hypothetical protein